MAVWKSREGKAPPSNWYAQLIGHLVQSYPAAQLDAAELTAQLQPIWDEQWRNGKNAQTVAATTCSCDGGRTIQPSPGVSVSLPRGSVRGPTKLPRGVIPDPAALRESLDLEKLKRAAVASATRATRSLELLRAHAKRAKPKTEEGLVIAQRKHQEIRASLAAEMVVLQSLRDQISEERSKRELVFVNALPALPSAPAKSAADDLDIVLGIKAPKAPKAPKVAAPKAPGKRRGSFEITGDELILRFVKEKGSVTTEQIRKHWEASNRGGKSDNNLTNLVKSGKLVRSKDPSGPGSLYTAPAAAPATTTTTP